MAKAATSFVCRECGYNSPKYLGKCPNCGNWSTMEEFKETTSNAKRPSLVQHSEEAHKTKPMRLDQVSYERVNRVKTSISELDRVLGGGVVPGSLVLIGGDPGIGKSTLLLQVSSDNKHKGPFSMYPERKVRLKLKCVRSVSGCKQTDFIFTLKQT